MVKPGNKVPLQLAKQTYVVKEPSTEEQENMNGETSVSELTMIANRHLKLDPGYDRFSISASIDESVKDVRYTLAKKKRGFCVNKKL